MNSNGNDLHDKPLSGTSGHAVNLDRIRHLIADLEQELARADIPQAHEVRKEIDTLKQMLASPDASPDKEEGWAQERLHAVRSRLQDMTARVEGEVLKDSPYIAEIGRILGLV